MQRPHGYLRNGNKMSLTTPIARRKLEPESASNPGSYINCGGQLMRVIPIAPPINQLSSARAQPFVGLQFPPRDYGRRIPHDSKLTEMPQQQTVPTQSRQVILLPMMQSIYCQWINEKVGIHVREHCFLPKVSDDENVEERTDSTKRSFHATQFEMITL